MLCPAWIVTGSESPLKANVELLLFAAVTVTLAPVAFRLPVAVPLLPTSTFPTGIVPGLTLSWPATVTPVPVADPVVVEGDALLVNVRVVLAAPEV